MVSLLVGALIGPTPAGATADADAAAAQVAGTATTAAPCTARAASETAALAMAARCGTDVTVVGAGSATVTLVAQADGDLRIDALSRSGSLNEWTAVRDVHRPAYKFSPDQGLGLCSRSASKTCTGTFTSRLMWEFNGLRGIGGLDPADIVSATLVTRQTRAHSCTASSVDAYRVAPFTSRTTWPGGPWTDARRLDRRTVGCPASGLVTFDVTRAAKVLAREDGGTLALGLKAVNERTMRGWKRFASGPTLSVVFNRAPVMPTGLTIVDRKCVPSDGGRMIAESDPVLKASIGEPDGDSASAVFDVSSTKGDVLWTSAPTQAKPAGSQHEVQVPAGVLHKGVYEWGVRGVDDAGRVGPRGTCVFYADVEPPAMPDVVALPGTTQYLEGETSGAVDLPGTFRFSTTSTDTFTFYYRTGGILWRTVRADDPVVRFVPRRSGPHTLSVQAHDGVSFGPIREYHFSVAATTPPSHRWLLNEEAGLTAADSGTTSPGVQLGVAESVTREAGLLTALGAEDGDRALGFDESSDRASAGVPVITIGASFTAVVVARLDDVSATATAMSQDGDEGSGFELGLVVSPACPTGDGRCWGFTMNEAVGGEAVPVRSLSAVPVREGGWVQLAGVYSKNLGLMQVVVCDYGTPADPNDDLTPHLGSEWRLVTPSPADGPAQLGRGLVASESAHEWRGAVGTARAYSGVLELSTMRRLCSLPEGL